MARVIGDLCFPAGKYVKDGEEKTRWMKVGIALETDKGMRIKLDAIPVVSGDNGLWLSVFEKDNRQQGFREKPAQKPVQEPVSGDEDVPF
jgi:DNA-binding cell septation regulator SpoVG